MSQGYPAPLPVRHRAAPLIVAFLLAMSGVIPPTGARAAGMRSPSTGTITTVVMEVLTPRDRICVGRTYDITVKTSLDKDISKGNGKVEHISAEVVSSITVQGSVDNPGVGTLSPQRLVTGFALDDEPGSAAFTFEAKKAGSTTLKFKAIYRGRSIPAQRSLTVETCAYTVSMSASDVFAGGDVVIWTVGHLSTPITGSGDQLVGKGDFLFVSGFVGPPCNISYSDFDNPTTITGTVDEHDQLVLEFQYQPGTISSAVTCPDMSASTSYVIDLTKTGIASATFPATGGTRSLTFEYAGSDMGPGTMVIDVEPIAEQAGG